MRIRTQLREIASFAKGSQINGDDLIKNGEYDYLNGGITPSGKWNAYNTLGRTVTISEGGNSCGYVNYMRKPFWCGAHCYYLFNTINNTEYLYYMLKSQQDRLMKLRSGACMPNIKKADLGSFELEYEADTDKQQHVVSILESIEGIITARKQQLSALDDLIKARFVEMFGDGLEHKRLEEYTTLITKGASPKWQGIEYCDEGTLFVTSENVREGFVDLSKRKYLPDDINKILPRSVLRKNDILINIVGASIGRAAVYESDELANINQAVALVRLIPNAINKDFLLAFLNGEEAQKAYIAMKKGGARDNLSLKNIADLQIPVATVEQQNEFATFVAQVDKSKSVIQKSLDETQLLFDSLMQKYFG